MKTTKQKIRWWVGAIVVVLASAYFWFLIWLNRFYI